MLCTLYKIVLISVRKYVSIIIIRYYDVGPYNLNLNALSTTTESPKRRVQDSWLKFAIISRRREGNN